MILPKRQYWLRVALTEPFTVGDIIWVDESPERYGWHEVVRLGDKKLLVYRLRFYEVWELKIKSAFRRK